MSGFIYLWFDRKHRRFYLGSHWGPENDGYVCSSSWMLKGYRRRPEDFKRRIIARVATNRVDLLVEEQRWLNMIQEHEIKHRYYNLKRGECGLWYANDDARLTVGQKISKALKGRKKGKRPPEHGAAIAVGKKKANAARRAATGLPYAYKPGSLEKLRSRPTWNGHTEAHRKHIKGVMASARAANPQWDRKYEHVCPSCGEPFMGRESQKYCTIKCGQRLYMRLRRAEQRSNV